MGTEPEKPKLSTLGERLRFVRVQKGWGQTELARRSHVKVSTISEIEQDRIKRSSYSHRLAAALDCRVEWLQDGEGPPDSPVEPGPAVTKTRATPIVGRAMLGENGYFIEEDYPAGFGDGFIDHPTRDPNAYSLRVVGDSMMPAIRNGWYVTCEPNSTCRVGEFVHVLTKAGQHMVKELLYDRADEVTLLSINGDRRLSLPKSQLEYMHHIDGVYPPSKRRL